MKNGQKGIMHEHRYKQIDISKNGIQWWSEIERKINDGNFDLLGIDVKYPVYTYIDQTNGDFVISWKDKI